MYVDSIAEISLSDSFVTLLDLSGTGWVFWHNHVLPRALKGVAISRFAEGTDNSSAHYLPRDH